MILFSIYKKKKSHVFPNKRYLLNIYYMDEIWNIENLYGLNIYYKLIFTLFDRILGIRAFF